MTMDYTTPVTTMFEMQRQTIKQSQQMMKQGFQFQQSMNDAFLDSFETQESAQRRGVELSQTAFHGYLDAVESMVPGTAATVDEIRTAVDEQFSFLLENHADAFGAFEAEYEEGSDAYSELTTDYLEALDEQIEMVLDAHEQMESQSVDATEQWADQLAMLQDQVEDVQSQIQDVQQQAAEAVEA
jgi:hypothetical protein